MRQLSIRNPVVLGVVASLGVLLVVAPWVAPRSLDLPPEIRAGQPAQERLLQLARAVDGAFARGDVDGLRAQVTPAQWSRMDAWVRGAGRTLDAATLREQGYLIGDVDNMPYLHGASRADAAVLVFARGPGIATSSDRRSLFGVRFAWDGWTLRLDGKRSLTVPPLDDLAARAVEWAAELLGEVRTVPGQK